MREGYFARHLKRMRSLYAVRRQSLADALSAVFGDRLAVDLEPGGMHLVARVAAVCTILNWRARLRPPALPSMLFPPA